MAGRDGRPGVCRFDIGLRRIGAPSRIAWSAYWAIAIYTAINIPVGRVVSTPLTRPMLRAARGPAGRFHAALCDRDQHRAGPVGLAAAAVLPWLLGRVPRPLSRLALVCILPVVLLGPMASRRVDTRGMDRNAVTALIGSRVPRATARPACERLARIALPRQAARPRISRALPEPPADSTW